MLKTLDSILMNIKLLFIVLTMSVSAMAQDKQPNEMRYVFGENNCRVSGFGAPIFEFSSYNGSFAFYTGGGGAAIFNNTFYIGGFGMGLAENASFGPIYNDNGVVVEEDLSLSFGYGGLWVGYIFRPNAPIHFGISSKFGGGAAVLSYAEFDHSEFEYHMDYVGVVSPQIEVELNLARWFKINFGVGYKFIVGVSDAEYIYNAAANTRPYFDKNDFSTPYANISLLFGGFGNQK